MGSSPPAAMIPLPISSRHTSSPAVAVISAEMFVPPVISRTRTCVKIFVQWFHLLPQIEKRGRKSSAPHSEYAMPYSSTAPALQHERQPTAQRRRWEPQRQRYITALG